MFFCRPRTLFAGLLTFVVMLSACSPSAPDYPVLDGDRLSWIQLRDKVIFINYWAEWCKPCREEIPELNHFAKTNRDQATVLSVNFDGASGDDLLGQIKKMGVEFPTLLRDPRIELGLKLASGLPETIVLDRSGKVFKVLSGPQTQLSLEAVLSELDL